ncbi:MAG: hypothetical protein H6832_09415 [Planctomycetes bacterium]|nr:hypothetical protein [Planctomycetota bacterium]MCB9918609.1 hypothetical protein [Planctomycetota bacterium]
MNKSIRNLLIIASFSSMLLGCPAACVGCAALKGCAAASAGKAGAAIAATKAAVVHKASAVIHAKSAIGGAAAAKGQVATAASTVGASRIVPVLEVTWRLYNRYEMVKMFLTLVDRKLWVTAPEGRVASKELSDAELEAIRQQKQVEIRNANGESVVCPVDVR